LYEACENGQIAKLKGFGLKTQEAIKENLAYIISQRGKLFYADAEPLAEQLLQSLERMYPDDKVALTGDMRRKMETVDAVEILVGNKNADARHSSFSKKFR
jgi:DNA polymerase (family 10)